MIISLYGILAERVGASELQLPAVNSVGDLRTLLEEQYPGIDRHCYMVAVNKVRADQQTSISEFDEIVILPPFAGG